MDADQVGPLLTEAGWALLQSLPPYEADRAMALGERLREQGHPAELVAAAMTQARLRAAGHAKFGPFADSMLFTAAGLEQATRLQVAARHAQRFAAAGLEVVADLGCGIGGDAMALAGLDRQVLAVDRDEATAAAATVNLRHWPGARVRCEDAVRTDLSGVHGAFLDPARRTGTGRRLMDPRSASPPLSFALQLSDTLAGVGVKTAPGISRDLLPAQGEAQWVSVGGDVVEAGLWLGAVARPGVRRAALLLPADDAGPRGPAEVTDAGLPSVPVGPVGAVLYEPDGAVIRAGLVGHVAAAVDGRLLDATIAYVTADRVVPTPLARGYLVEDVFGFQLKTLRTYLRDRGVGRLTVKKRGTAVDPQQLRRQLRLTGAQEATIVLTRVAGRQSVLVVRPLPR